MSKKNEKFKVVLEFKVADSETFVANKAVALGALQQFLNVSDLASVGLKLKSQKIGN